MATRFYFPSTGAAAATPANDAWNLTSGASSALAMVTKRIASAQATITANGNGTIGHTSLLRQYVSDRLPYAMTITGKVRGMIRTIESSSSGNNTLAVSIRACSSDGSTIRTPALLAISASDSTDATMWEMPITTAASRAFADVNENRFLSLTACNVSLGDRLVVEIGFRAGSTTTTRTGGVVCGDDATPDLNEVHGVTTANNPWIEFTADLFVQPGAGYFS